MKELLNARFSTPFALVLATLFIPSTLLANTAETQSTSDGIGASSLTGTANWTPATAVSPTNALAGSYDYTTGSGITLRTPANANAYTSFADSLTFIGELGFKGSNVITIPNLILSGGTIQNSGTGGNPDMGRLAGTINLTASSTIRANGTNAIGTTYVNVLSVITNAPGVYATLTVNTAGTVILSGQNTFNGAVTVDNVGGTNAVLQLGTNNALPSTATVTLAAGANYSPVLDLHGNSTTISNLTFTTGAVTGYVTNTAAGTTNTLTLGYGNGSETLSYGTIADNPATAGTVALTKTGTGTLTLVGTNGYRGPTTITAGTLALGGGGQLNNGSYAGNITNNSAFVDGSSATQTLSGPISGTGSLTQSGIGMLTLAGANTYTGSTTITGGTLALSGGGSISNSTAIIVDGGAVFNVAGLANGFILGAGQTLSNAASATGRLNGSLNTGLGMVSVSYSAGTPAFTVTNGTLTLSNATTVNINNTGSALVPGSYVVVATNATGAVAGTLPSVTVIGAGLATNTFASLAVQGGQLITVVQQIATPTSTTLVLEAGSDPSTYGNSLTFQATVSPAPTNGEAVTFQNGTTTLGTGLLTGGVAIFTTSALPAGSNSITAVYTGDGAYGGSTSGALSQTVNLAPLGVTANNSNWTYNGTGFSGGNGVTYAGFVNGETNTVLGGTLAFGGTSQGATNAGVYTLIPAGFTATNYSISYNNGTLTVLPAGLTITADNTNKVYGQNLALIGTAFTVGGLFGSDTVTNVSLTSAGVTNLAGAGSYSIIPGAAAGMGVGNYNITYVNGTLAVNPALLGVTANSVTNGYGATNPVFTATYTGFVNTDSLTNSDVVGAPALTTGTTAGSPVGTYVITNSLGTLASTNYAFALTNGTLTIAYEAIKTWDGGAGTVSWSGAANWNPNGLPAVTNAVVLNNAFTNLVPSIDATGGGSLGTLTVDGAVAGTFLSYPGATPQVFNLYGLSNAPPNFQPLVSITTNAPPAVTANKINFTLRTSGSLFISASNTLTLDNCIISESGGHCALTLTGGGTLAFSGSAPSVTFSGGLNLAQGSINASDVTACLPTNGTIAFINGPGTNANIYSSNSHTISALAGGNSNSLVQIVGAAGLTVNGASNTVFSGVIDDDYPAGTTTRLTYAGSGSLTLNADNLYTGPTVISSGRLALGTNGNIWSTNITVAAGGTFDVSAVPGGYTLQSGQTLYGSGLLLGGFTAGGGSVVSPGTNGGLGTLTFSNGFTLAAGAHFAFTLTNGAGSPLVVGSGNVVLAGDLGGSTVTGSVSPGTVMYLILNNGTGTTTGTLGGVGDGGEIQLSGQHYLLSLTSSYGGAGFQTNGGGNDVAIQAIYDPAPVSMTFSNTGSLTLPAGQTLLTWQNTATNATGYTISRSINGGPPVLLGTVGAAATTFTDTNAPTTTTNVYTIQAFNGGGDLGNPAALTVPSAVLSVAQRQQQFLTALATLPVLAMMTENIDDLKYAGAYYLNLMLANPPGSAKFQHAQTAFVNMLDQDVAAADTDPFELFTAMHGYLLESNLFTAGMAASTKQLAELMHYSTNGSYVSENYNFMYTGSAFLACEQWPDFTDAGGQTGPGFQAALKAQLMTYFQRIVTSNLWEHGSAEYVCCDQRPIRMLAEFARDPELKQMAWDTLDWLNLTIACDWNQGYYATAPARNKGWGAVLGSPDNLSGTPLHGWMYYGAYEPITNMADFADNAGFWMAYPRQYQVPPIFQQVAGQRFTPVRQRTTGVESPTDTDFKYAWHMTNYSLASDYIMAGNPQDLGKERMPVVLKWLSSSPESTLVVDMVNQSSFYSVGGLNKTTYVPSPNIMGYGENPYTQNYQIQQTVVGVANVSPWYADQNGNATNGTGLDPLYYAQFYVPLTTQGAILQTVVSNGWVFCHGGSVLFGIWTYATNYFGTNAAFGPNPNNCNMLYSSGLQNAWVLETASVDQYPAATNTAAQLAAFAADVLAHGTLVTNNMSAVLPQIQYTSIHGYTMKLTWCPCQTDEYWTVPPRFPALPGWNTNTAWIYTNQCESNGVAINYNYTNQGWPLLDNPWLTQKVGQTNLTVAINGYTNTYWFRPYSTNWSQPPWLTAFAPLTITTGQQAVVPFTVYDMAFGASLVTNSITSANAALLPPSSLALAGTGTNCTLTISPTGPAGTTTLTLTAINPAGMISSVPIVVTVVTNTVGINVVRPPSPPLLGAVTWTNGGLQIKVSGVTNVSYTVQASTNLLTWTNLLVTNPPVMPFIWRDTNTPNFRQRFYRVEIAP